MLITYFVILVYILRLSSKWTWYYIIILFYFQHINKYDKSIDKIIKKIFLEAYRSLIKNQKVFIQNLPSLRPNIKEKTITKKELNVYNLFIKNILLYWCLF